MSLRRELPRFFGFGLVSTLLDYAVMIFCREAGGLDPVWAALLGYCCGGVLSYAMNRRHTFATDRTHLEAGWRFAIVMAIGFALTGACMALFADALAVPFVLARIVTTGLVFCWNFFAHRSWTFARRAV